MGVVTIQVENDDNLWIKRQTLLPSQIVSRFKGETIGALFRIRDQVVASPVGVGHGPSRGNPIRTSLSVQTDSDPRTGLSQYRV
jgi:hypothetical protein